MDQGTLSLLLGIAGLVLGFVSAYGKIKLFTIRAARASGEAAKRWVARQDALTTLFVAYPSAFAGFVVRRVVWVAFAYLIGTELPLAFHLGVLKAPHWVVSASSFVPWLVVGIFVNSLTTMSGNVIRFAKSARAADRSRG